jgi:hypothetical protein
VKARALKESSFREAQACKSGFLASHRLYFSRFAGVVASFSFFYISQDQAIGVSGHCALILTTAGTSGDTMTVLERAIEAHGGATLWSRLRRFSAHLSIEGALFTRKGKPGALKDVIADGSTRQQSLRLTGFTAPDRRAIYGPDRVTIESLEGRVLAERQNPGATFASQADSAPWDDLDLAYFSGYSVWNCLMSPFLLTSPGFVCEEIEPWAGEGEVWRRLKVHFPADVVTHSPEQIFYFDARGLQRRADYRGLAADGAPVASYMWAHQECSGILLATHRSAHRIAADGLIVGQPAVTIDVLDAAFD